MPGTIQEPIPKVFEEKGLENRWNKVHKESLSARQAETRRGSPIDRRTSAAEAPPIGKIPPFNKIAVTLEPVMQFGCPLRFRSLTNL